MQGRAVAGFLCGLLVLMAALSGPLCAASSPIFGNGYASGGERVPQVLTTRLGLHPDKTRFVLEVSDRLTFRATVQSDPNQAIVDLPDMVWPGGDGPKVGQGVIRSYHVEHPQPGTARLILDVIGPVRIVSATVMPPSEGHQVRFVLDLALASPAAFAEAKTQVRGTRLPLEAGPGGGAENGPGRGAPEASSAGATRVPSVLSPLPMVEALPPPVAVAPQMTVTVAPEVMTRATMAPTPLRPVGATGGRADSPRVAASPAVLVSNMAPRSDPAPVNEAVTPPPQTRVPTQMVAALAPPSPPPPATASKPRRVRPSGKPMIALDPGHGGVDPGATGINGIHEKDITLATAREVQRQLEATGRFRVMLTRDEDVFVPLRERVAAARQAGADLFVSLHADSISSSEIRGLSVYTQSDKGSDHEAETLAAKENRADAIGGIDLSRENDQVATILIDLAQRDTRNHSRHFATLVLREASHLLRLLPKPDRAAAFAVLTAPDVPSVLIEMGYLSSPDDASLLIQPLHRQRLAGAVVRAIDGYFLWLTGGHRS